jgi:antitoxin (DNA-binding transcriptional repressor) of toxin-antitoxin stability system
MQTLAIEQVEGRLAEIVKKLSPGEEFVLTQNNHPVARLVGGAAEKPQPIPGRGRGMLTVIAEDDDHLKDFAEYMP